MSRVSIAPAGELASSCYFRTTVPDGQRKALVQIHEPCNLRCAHCFVSATPHGASMPLVAVRELAIPRLARAGVTRVTLTGGEPFMHPNLIEIAQAFRDAGMSVGLCTNATLVRDGQISALAEMGAHVNVSLDGFDEESHGKFRGDRASFAVTVETVRRLGSAGILQGLLCTPNTLAQEREYHDLATFAGTVGATYVLMNPLSSMGRGIKSRDKLGTPEDGMRRISALVDPFESPSLEMVRIRFPNDGGLPLSGCEAGRIVYIFTPGDVTVCPYLVFAAENANAQHTRSEFVVGNIFRDDDIAERLAAYPHGERLAMGHNEHCPTCPMTSRCGKGCPAAVVEAGQRIGAVDTAQCPVVPDTRRRLPVVSR